MKRLSSLPAPAVAGVVREKNTRSAIAEIRNCYLDGADMIDLHMSCLENRGIEELKKIIKSTSLPILALNYNNSYSGSRINMPEEERVQSFRDAIDAGAAGIDMQGYTFHAPSKKSFCGEDRYSFTKDAPKEVVTDPEVIAQQCRLIEYAHSKGAEVLLSCHPGVAMTTQQVVDLALFLEERNPDIIKIVTKANTPEDLEESIKTMFALKRLVKTPVSYHANGKAGMLSRILNPVLGGQIAFCVDHYTESSTMEQLDLRAVRSVVDNIRKICGG